MKIRLVVNIRVYDGQQAVLVKAIRALRSFTNLSLKDAKDIIEQAIEEAHNDRPIDADGFPAQYVGIPLILSLEQFGYMSFLQAAHSEDSAGLWYDAVEEYVPPSGLDVSANSLNLS